MWLCTLMLALAVYAAPTVPALGINSIQSLEESASVLQRFGHLEGLEESNGKLIEANINEPTEAKTAILPRECLQM